MKFLHNYEQWLLALILVIAAALRLYHLDFSFSNDELSAISRLQFDGLFSLVQNGVRIDGHPAFTQVFLYYWTNLFGFTEWIVRLPFALWGIASVYLVYKIGKAWFGVQPALLAAAAISVLSFFILYSQLARPYSPGLFFTLLATWHWTRILQGSQSWHHPFWGGLAVALAMYTHYFSFMQVVLLAIVGLLWLRRNQVRYYVVAAVVAVVLWLPHIGITLYQLSIGSVGGWLDPPANDYPMQFILYVFNESLFALFACLAAALVGLIISLPRINLNKWQFACILLLVFPVSIGFAYSKLVSPVIQHSTLLFAAPCLLLLLFSFAGNKLPRKVFTVVLTGMMALLMLNTVFTNQFYNKEHFSVFRELAEKMQEWDAQFGAENISRATHLNSPYYVEHYLEQLNHNAKIELYNIESDSSLAELNRLVHQSTAPYFAFFWSKGGVPFEAYEIIRSKYPGLVDADYHFHSGSMLFSKRKSDERNLVFELNQNSELHKRYASHINEEKLQTDSIGWRYTLSPQDEYSFSYRIPGGEVQITGGELLVIKARVSSHHATDITLVFEYQSETHENQWHGTDLYPVFVLPDQLTHELILSRPIPKNPHPNDEILVYLWKRAPQVVEISSFNITAYPQSSSPIYFNYNRIKVNH